MHILILSPLNCGFFEINSFFEEDNNYYSIIANRRHENSYKDKIKLKNVSISLLNQWNIESLTPLVKKINNSMKIQKIFSYEEFDVEIAAHLRDLLGIDGQKYEDALLFRDKYLMKMYLKKYNISIPRFKKVDTFDELLHSSSVLTFPLILKPRMGSGGEGCVVICNKYDILRLKDTYNFDLCLVEEFINKPVYHIDGLIINNNIEYIIPSKYVSNCLAYKERKSCISVQLDDNDIMRNKLICYTKEIVNKLLFTKNSLFHLEVFADENSIVFCEIACRIGGGRILQCIKQRLGYNALKKLFYAEAEKKFYEYHLMQDKHMTMGFILVSPKQGTILNNPNPREVFNNIFDYYPFARIGMKYNLLNSCVENIAAVSIEGNSQHDVERELLEIDKWYFDNCIYENSL